MTRKRKCKGKTKHHNLAPSPAAAKSTVLPRPSPVDSAGDSSCYNDIELSGASDRLPPALPIDSTEQCNLASHLPTQSTDQVLRASTFAASAGADATANANIAMPISYANIARLSVPVASDNTSAVNEGNHPSRNLKAIAGCNASSELEVAPRIKWLHLSSFLNSVTTDNIIAYVSKHTTIDSSLISCHMLVKKNVVVKTLKRVNFKIGVPSSHYESLLNSAIWPADVNVRPFEFFRNQERHN